MFSSLDHYSKGSGFQITLRPVTKCEERICQLSVIPGKRNHEFGHIKRKDQGYTALLVYLVGPLCLAHNHIPYQDSKCTSQSIHQPIDGLLFSAGTRCVYAQQSHNYPFSQTSWFRNENKKMIYQTD